MYFRVVDALNLPPFPFKIQNDAGILKIFDPLRRKYLVLTPEEWVRQHFVQFLVSEKGFPKGLFILENSVKYAQRKGRFDILCVSRNGVPKVLVECKAHHVKITPAVFDQIGRYNTKLKAPYMVVTNGIQHFFMKMDFEKNKVEFLENLPHYEYLSP